MDKVEINEDGNLAYRGLIGSRLVDDEDDCLYGQVLYIRDLVNYEGERVSALKVAFKEAVDDYLDCPALESSKFQETGTNNLMEEDDE